MFDIYFKLINKLEQMGKYKQADSVEKFIRSAQARSNAPQYGTGLFSPQQYFDYYKGQQSFTPTIETQGTSARPLDLNNLSYTQLTPAQQQLLKYNPQARMEIERSAKDVVNSLSQGRGAANFNNMIAMIEKSLTASLAAGLLPTDLNKQYIERFDGPVQMQIQQIIMGEQDVNSIYNGIFNTLNKTNLLKTLPAITDKKTGTIAKALNTSLQNLMPKGGKVDPKVVMKYNQIVVDPRFRDYIDLLVFRPVPMA